LAIGARAIDPPIAATANHGAMNLIGVLMIFSRLLESYWLTRALMKFWRTRLKASLRHEFS
jgi:hypothetical protein